MGLFVILLTGMSTAAWAQSAPSPSPTPSAAPRPPARPGRAPPPAADGDADTVAAVTVRGQRVEPGAVVGDIKPEVQFTAADIQSFGVSSVTDLLAELAPQTRSGRGRGGESPVILLNGRRISGFNEVRDIPTEAILRVDILPEEVSLKYGYSADQKVVNIVLRRRFRAITGELTGGAATEGGAARGSAEGDLLHLRNDDRLNLDLKVSDSASLTERERGLSQGTGTTVSDLTGLPLTLPTGVGAGPDGASDRTLVPESRSVSLNGVQSHSTLGGIGLTLNGTLEASHSRALQGLPTVSLLIPAADPFSTYGQPVRLSQSLDAFGPLTQTTDTWSAHLGVRADRDLGKWRLSGTAAYDHSDSLTLSQSGLDTTAAQGLLTDLSPGFDPFAPPGLSDFARLPNDKARSLSDDANAQFLASGPLRTLPAGDLYTSFKIGETLSGFTGDTLRNDVAQHSYLARSTFNTQLNLDLPLASAKKHVFGFLGELSTNANLAVSELSDYGALNTVGFGINWTPVTGYTLILSTTHDEAAPSQQQLDGPVTQTAGVRVLDYSTGQTVQVIRLDGGNPALTADSRNVTRIGLTVKPLADRDLTFQASYNTSRIRNAPASLPAATAQVEAAFPDRFIRDAQGRLVEIDNRPVTFAEEHRDQLRWGINFSMPIGPAPPPRPTEGLRSGDGRPDGNRSGGPGGPGGGGGGFGGFGGFGGGRGPQQGRFQVAVYHTVYFTDTILVRRGGPLFDLLNGSASGSAGGQPRHEVEAQLGYLKSGLGMRLSADWKSATRVDGAVNGPLDFSDLATVNLRLFDNLGAKPEVVKALPWARGVRLSLAVTNLFDARQSVRDATGRTPLSYQPAYLDPTGRVMTVSLRKLFF